MIKYRLYFDKDKETKWLNEMANQGWAISGFFAGLYTFEKCEEGKYTYQIDFTDKFGSVTEDYREFMTENNVEIVQSWGFWVILKKLSSEGDFQLYSDIDSQIEHYSKILKMFKIVSIIELLCFLMELFSAVKSNEPVIWGFVFLLFAILIVIVKESLHIGDIIHELNERKTGIEEPRNRNVSPILPIGLLLNSCALIIADTVSRNIKLSIQILAIICMLIGLYQTAQRRK